MSVVVEADADVDVSKEVNVEVSVGDVGVEAGVEVHSLAAEAPAANTRKAQKAVKAKKTVSTKKSKSAPLHPPYEEMIKDAIVSMAEKTGSSQYAITKFIEEKYKSLPANFRKLLLFHLKKLVSEGKIVKVKRSFKLPPAEEASSTSTRTSPGKRAAAKPVSKKAPAKKGKK